MLPTAARPRLLVPSERRAGAAAVRRYGEPGSLTAWVGSRALALALVPARPGPVSAADCGSAPDRAPTPSRPTCATSSAATC